MIKSRGQRGLQMSQAATGRLPFHQQPARRRPKRFVNAASAFCVMLGLGGGVVVAPRDGWCCRVGTSDFELSKGKAL